MVSMLKVGDSLLEEVEDVKAVALNHFTVRFQEQNFKRPKLHGVSFKVLSLVDRYNLELPQRIC